VFCLTLLALEPFFSVKFNLLNKPEDRANNAVKYTTFEEWKRLKERWVYDFKPEKIIDVSVDTYEMLGERDNILSVIPEESNLSKNVTSENTVDYKQDVSESDQTEPMQEPVQEPAEGKEGSDYGIKLEPDQESDQESEQATEQESEQESEQATEQATEQESEQESEPERETEQSMSKPIKTRPEPKRKGTGKTPKISVTRKGKGTSLNTVFESKSKSLGPSVPSGPNVPLNNANLSEPVNTTRKQPNLSLNEPNAGSIESSKKSTSRKAKPRQKSKSPSNIGSTNPEPGSESVSTSKTSGKMKMKGIPSVKSKKATVTNSK
jgi:hypothetical protein